MKQAEICPLSQQTEGLEELVRRLLELSRSRQPVLAALDGRCASGKTTLARALEEKYGWSVIHMDHFFLRPEQRTPQRLSTPGENVDHERFLDEVLRPLKAGQSVRYRPFDCHAMALGEPIKVESGPVILVEGAYACHPTLWDYYDLRAFLTVEGELQRERILKRNGPERFKAFRERWIPLEEAYLSAWDVERRCDVRLEAGKLPALP